MKNLNKSFAARLSLKFTTVLAAAMLLLTGIFILLISMAVNHQEAAQLRDNAELIFENLNDDKQNYNLPYGMSWAVFDENENTIFTNDPFLPFLEDSKGKVRRYFAADYFSDGDLNLHYLSKTDFVENLGQSVTIVTAVTQDESFISIFLKNLPRVLIFVIILVLAVSYLICFIISKNTIKPVVQITESAKKISSSNLKDLLPVTGRQDEIDELSGTFNKLFTKLAADFARERQFSSDVSHELKTPLAVIAGQSSLLLRWGKNDPVQLENSLLSIKNETKSMQAIIENLLEISRYENGTLKPQIRSVNIKALFERLKNEFSSIAPYAKIIVHQIDEEAVLKSDEELLHQIYTILISNSLKFAGYDCCITIGACLENGKCVFTEEDNGPGFTDEMLPHIYERFYRGDEAHSRKAGGCGLGLSIAQTLVTVLNGTIKAENSQQHGALFTIKI